MPPPGQPIDVISVAVLAASALLGVGAGTVVGTYSVIILCALGGAACSASNKEPFESNRRVRTLLHIVLRVGLSVLCAVPLSELAASGWPQLHVQWLFGPVAAVIAWQPPWAVRLVRAILERTGLVERRA